MGSSRSEGHGPPAAVKAAVIILILVLVLIVALLVRSGRRRAAGRAASGGGEDPAPKPPHTLGDALHKVRMDQARRPDHAHIISSPPPPQIMGRPPTKVARHGGGGGKKTPKAKKPWTKYKTWEALCDDEGAVAAYWDDAAAAINNLQLDWGGVREALAKTVYDDREWAGRINYVDGKLKVVELVPSPHAVGEGPLARQAGAMVPAEVMRKLEAKPGLFLFHTHPGETGGSATPSAMDMAGAMHIALTGRYAGEVVVSPYGVFLYTPSAETRRRVWSAGAGGPHPEKAALLATLRHTADLLGAFDGARSWVAPWALDDYASLARRYGMDYVVFPNDSYAHQRHRMGFTSAAGTDHDTHQEYLARIKELEEEVGEQSIVAAPAVPRSTALGRPRLGRPRVGRPKMVRFAPGV